VPEQTHMKQFEQDFSRIGFYLIFIYLENNFYLFLEQQ